LQNVKTEFIHKEPYRYKHKEFHGNRHLTTFLWIVDPQAC